MEIDESVLIFPLNMHEAKIAQRKHTYYLHFLFCKYSVIPFGCVTELLYEVKKPFFVLNPNWHEGGHFPPLALFGSNLSAEFLSEISKLFWR